MNLRIESQDLRFRITKKELETLCNKGSLEQQTLLPNEFLLEINIRTKNRQQLLFLTFENNQITLYVQKSAAENLYNSLPTREGLQCAQIVNESVGLSLSLEVDIRTQKNKLS